MKDGGGGEDKVRHGRRRTKEVRGRRREGRKEGRRDDRRWKEWTDGGEEEEREEAVQDG